MKKIQRTELKEKLDRGEDIVLVEVLGPKSYNDFHLPGAINVPRGPGFADRIQEAIPNHKSTVVVYCADSECDASPKAASEMENLGYVDVLDYEAGKQDWKSAGLPTSP